MKSAWSRRFDDLLSDDVIYRRAMAMPDCCRGLDKLQADEAVSTLKHSLQQIYIPSENSISIMKKLISMAASFSDSRFPSSKAFLKELYNPREDPVFPHCLTGPAGVGKSQLIKALGRVMPESGMVDPGDGHSGFTMQAMWNERAKKLVPMLRSFLKNDTGRSHVDELVEACRRKARRDGVSLIVIDELQAFSASESASALVTSTILQLCNIGVPLVYACNYSLCHKFIRRNDHDRHRLLGSPHILLPDDMGSRGWHEFLDACCKVSGGAISCTGKEAIIRLHNYSAGLKRLAVELMCLAYSICRQSGAKKADLSHLQQAYLSPPFSVYRKDVEILLRQEAEGKRVREDLWCPFDLPPKKQQIVSEKWSDIRKEKLASATLDASLTVKERENLRLVSNNIGSTKGKPKLPSVKKSGPRTSEELIANAMRIKELLNEEKK